MSRKNKQEIKDTSIPCQNDLSIDQKDSANAVNAEQQDNESPATQTAPKGGVKIGKGAMAYAGKAKNSKRALLQLTRYFGKFLPLIIIAIALAIGSAALTIMVPGKTGDMANLVQEGLKPLQEGLPIAIDMVAIGKIAIVALIMIILPSISHLLQGLIMTDVIQRTGRKFRTEINKKINKLPFSYFDSRVFGDVLSRVTNDVDTISNSVSQGLLPLIFNVTLLLGLVIVMFISNWVLAIVSVITIPLSLLIIGLMAKYSQKHFRNQQGSLGEMNGHIEETYSGHEVVKAYCGEQKAKHKFDAINEKMTTAVFKGNFVSGMMFPITHFISNLGLVAVCVVGGVLMINGKGDIGDIFAFFMYVRMFNQPVAQLAQIAAAFQSAAAAAERVFEFLGEKEMKDESDKPAVKIESFKGEVEFKNISFGYNKDNEIIHNFSAKALPGQKIAIVGPTGAGKTTMVNLLMRFYETGGGEILIDGVPISSMTRAQVHDLFGMVLQDTWLFEGTIKENIMYAKKGVTEEDVIEACKTAGIDHLIRSLPGSYDMILDETANLSAGQRQLITIARAIVENAPMLILDEATSAVDSRTEILIQQAMDKLMQGRTSFIIAHRLSTIKNADLILVMKDGGILEQGNHERLMEKGGFYCELYKSQFESV